MGKELVSGDVDFYSPEIKFTTVCCMMLFLTVWLSQQLHIKCCSLESSVEVSSVSGTCFFLVSLSLLSRRVRVTRNIPDFMYAYRWCADRTIHFQKNLLFIFFYLMREIRIGLLWAGSGVRVSSGDDLSFWFDDMMFLTVMSKKWNLFWQERKCFCISSVITIDNAVL